MTVIVGFVLLIVVGLGATGVLVRLDVLERRRARRAMIRRIDRWTREMEQLNRSFANLAASFATMDVACRNFVARALERRP